MPFTDQSCTSLSPSCLVLDLLTTDPSIMQFCRWYNDDSFDEKYKYNPIEKCFSTTNWWNFDPIDLYFHKTTSIIIIYKETNCNWHFCMICITFNWFVSFILLLLIASKNLSLFQLFCFSFLSTHILFSSILIQFQHILFSILLPKSKNCH